MKTLVGMVIVTIVRIRNGDRFSDMNLWLPYTHIQRL